MARWRYVDGIYASFIHAELSENRGRDIRVRSVRSIVIDDTIADDLRLNPNGKPLVYHMVFEVYANYNPDFYHVFHCNFYADGLATDSVNI